MAIKRGILARDLRPFSVADPLGQKRVPTAVAVDPLARYHSPRAQLGAPAPDVAGPVAAAKTARLGYWAMVVFWALTLLGSANAWLPELIDGVRPAIEKLIAQWEAAQGAQPPGAAVDSAPQPLPDPPSTPSSQDAPPGACAPGDPLCAPAPPPAAAGAELQRTCERTVQCCLTVQGERARAICENFRRMPTVEPCLQAYDAFVQVGAQLGRRCQE